MMRVIFHSYSCVCMSMCKVLIQSSFSSSVPASDLVEGIISRINFAQSWVVVLKSLTVFHKLLRDGHKVCIIIIIILFYFLKFFSFSFLLILYVSDVIAISNLFVSFISKVYYFI